MLASLTSVERTVQACLDATVRGVTRAQVTGACAGAVKERLVSKRRSRFGQSWLQPSSTGRILIS